MKKLNYIKTFLSCETRPDKEASEGIIGFYDDPHFGVRSFQIFWCEDIDSWVVNLLNTSIDTPESWCYLPEEASLASTSDYHIDEEVEKLKNKVEQLELDLKHTDMLSVEDMGKLAVHLDCENDVDEVLNKIEELESKVGAESEFIEEAYGILGDVDTNEEFLERLLNLMSKEAKSEAYERALNNATSKMDRDMVVPYDDDPDVASLHGDSFCPYPDKPKCGRADCTFKNCGECLADYYLKEAEEELNNDSR